MYKYIIYIDIKHTSEQQLFAICYICVCIYMLSLTLSRARALSLSLYIYMYMHAPTTHTNPTKPTPRIGDGYFIVIFVENLMVKSRVKISKIIKQK